jgi:hypothetical protein
MKVTDSSNKKYQSLLQKLADITAEVAKLSQAPEPTNMAEYKAYFLQMQKDYKFEGTEWSANDYKVVDAYQNYILSNMVYKIDLGHRRKQYIPLHEEWNKSWYVIHAHSQFDAIYRIVFIYADDGKKYIPFQNEAVETTHLDETVEDFLVRVVAHLQATDAIVEATNIGW